MNGVRILVTGDIEPEVQRLISEKYDLSDIDILKVPHHGSRFQDSSFISEVSPELSLISVGAGNSYGHPNSELIQELIERGSKVARTDSDGPISVAWRFDDSAKRYIFTMKTMRKEWWRIQWL
jgi:competence protein ComEC